MSEPITFWEVLKGPLARKSGKIDSHERALDVSKVELILKELLEVNWGWASLFLLDRWYMLKFLLWHRQQCALCCGYECALRISGRSSFAKHVSSLSYKASNRPSTPIR